MNTFDLISVELYTDGKPFILCVADEEKDQMLIEATGTFAEARIMVKQIIEDILAESRSIEEFEHLSKDFESALQKAITKIKTEKYHGKH